MVERIGPIQQSKKTHTPTSRHKITPSKPFSNLLQQKISEQIDLKFSGHALSRLQQRNIDLTPETISKLKHAVFKAIQKGSREALFLTQHAGYIINIPQKIVITVFDKAELKDRVFTNIDSTILVD